MISVSDFLLTVTPKASSKLLPFKDDIIALKKANLSNTKICEFLKLNGIDVSHQRIAVFLKEQGFNHKNQSSTLKAEHKSEFFAKETQRVGRQEFVKPSWVPEHIDIENLK